MPWMKARVIQHLSLLVMLKYLREDMSFLTHSVTVLSGAQELGAFEEQRDEKGCQ